MCSMQLKPDHPIISILSIPKENIHSVTSIAMGLANNGQAMYSIAQWYIFKQVNKFLQ